MKRYSLLTLTQLLLLSCSNAGAPGVSSYSEESIDYSQPFTLKMYAEYAYVPFLQSQCDAYVREYQLDGKVRIEVGDVPDPMSFEDVDLLIIGQSGPSGLQWERDFVKISPNYLNRVKAEFDPSCLNQVTVGEDIYAFPFYLSSYAFLYDSSLLSTEDIHTFSSLKEAVNRLPGDRLAYYDYANYWYMDAFFSSYDVQVRYAKENGTWKLARDDMGTEKAKRALYDLAPMIQNEALFTDDFRVYSSEPFFADPQKRARLTAGVFGIDQYLGIKETFGDSLVFAPMPISESAPSLPYRQTSLAVRRQENASKVAEAMRLANYLTSATSMSSFVREIPMLPANLPAQKSAEDPFVKGLAENFTTGYVTNFIFDEDFYTAYLRLLKSVSALEEGFPMDELDPLLEEFESTLHGEE